MAVQSSKLSKTIKQKHKPGQIHIYTINKKQILNRSKELSVIKITFTSTIKAANFKDPQAKKRKKILYKESKSTKPQGIEANCHSFQALQTA